MNRAARLSRIAILACGIALGSASCVDINGGAVEVSWAVFARDGRAINDCSCANPAIVFVRLQLTSQTDPTSQPCAGNDACRFTCGRKTGATPFIIPPGQYLMSIVPVDAGGNDLPSMVSPPGVVMPSVQTPAPESRSVMRGAPTDLDAFMLEADCADRCNSGGIFNPCTAG